MCSSCDFFNIAQILARETGEIRPGRRRDGV
jgi:hypothetical protein